MKLRRIISDACALFALGYIVVVNAQGCGYLPGDGVTDQELAYRAELLRCVDKAETLAESKLCRRSADAKWGVRPDGGK